MNPDQVLSFLSLHAEILGILAASTVLGWFIGSMMQRSRLRKKLKAAKQSWEARYAALEETTRADADNLEEQLQAMARETKSLQTTNKALTDSLKKSDVSIQKARAESIELNRQHAETQERLQRIIQQKDREILELGNRLSDDDPVIVPSTANLRGNPSDVGTDDIIPSLTDVQDLNNADTIALNTDPNSGTVVNEAFDSTIQMSALEKHDASVKTGNTYDHQAPESELDQTADISSLGMDDLEEATVALDDDALAFAQRSYPTRSRSD